MESVRKRRLYALSAGLTAAVVVLLLSGSTIRRVHRNSRTCRQE